MILGAIADGIQLANQAVQATGSAIQVGAAELVRQERMFWGLEPTVTDPAAQAKQDAALRETAWGQALGPNVPIEVLRSIDRLPTDEDKLLVAQLLKGRHETGIAGSGFEPGAIDLTDQQEDVLEAVLKEVKHLRDELELYRFAAGEHGAATSAAGQGLQRAADVLEQFAAHYANGGEALNVYA
jgi:hypothetical protein